MRKTIVRPFRRALAPLALASALAAWAPRAEAGDKALAEALFQEGRKLADAGNHEGACQKFEASQKQDPSPGTLINLGKCHEAMGKTATAWANYKEAEALARNMSRSSQETAATERANAIEPKLSRLTIQAPPKAVDGLVVKRGGISISVDALGTAAPVDPGDYVVEASAPGYKPWTGKVKVGKDGESATLLIPNLEKGPDAPAAVEPAGNKSTAAVAPEARVKSDDGGGSTRTIGYVLTGVGAVGLLAGGYFGYAASQQASDAEDDPTLCPQKQCTARGRDEIDSAKSKALISTIGVGVGVAALGTGVVLILTAPSNRERAATSVRTRAPRAPQLIPYADARHAGLVVKGAF
ncbi:MAG: hypothetical protein U0263_31690 [Polyangiaceae bacterium]